MKSLNAKKQALKDIKAATTMDIRNDSYGYLDHYTAGVTRIDTKQSRLFNKKLGL